MASLNAVTLIGRIGRAPEEVHAGQESFARFSVATDDGYTDKSGQRVDRTTWHTVTVGGKTADFVLKYLRKGSQVLVQGRYLSRKYQTKDGHDAVSWYVQAQRVQSLDSAPHDGKQQGQRQQGQTGGGYDDSWKY
jgi:single-strand DNA-binding protein|uniref:Single-stranded DNA-binding protein n=1 Tax=Siphoviridae sp. ct8Hx23 TaxID=2825360 RepID=A0A8S5P7C2_9CAUD|nr:MAG TPA: Single strand binding protein [Siphoviridae sp. ct8Hx23]